MTVEVESRANQAIELDKKIGLMETFWCGGLIASESLVKEIDRLLELLLELEQKALNPEHVRRYISRMKRKRAKYQKALDDGY